MKTYYGDITINNKVEIVTHEIMDIEQYCEKLHNIVDDEVLITIQGYAPYRKPFQSWEHANIGVYDNIEDALDSKANKIFYALSTKKFYATF